MTRKSESALAMAEEKIKGEEDGKMFPRPEMAESAIAAVNSRSEDSIPNERGASSAKKTNTASVNAKSCKGCLYYSSNFKANSRNPLCVGLSRSLPNVPQYITEDSNMHGYDEGKSLVDFRYSCVGYSLYKDHKGQTPEGKQTQTELPVCVGLEAATWHVSTKFCDSEDTRKSLRVLVAGKAGASNSASVPSHVHNKEDGNKLPQHRLPKPTNATGDEFLTRFTRNANLVANGVVKNMRRIGNQIKQSLDDALLPYRRRPK